MASTKVAEPSVHKSAVRPRASRYFGRASSAHRSPFVEEVPRLLRERGLSIRALAREVGVTDGHLSRVLRRVNYKTPGPELARRARARSLRWDQVDRWSGHECGDRHGRRLLGLRHLFFKQFGVGLAAAILTAK
jgi:hypothetical protein